MPTQTPDSPVLASTLSFPIRQFVEIPPSQIVEAINDLIVEINWVFSNSLGGGGVVSAGVVTKEQLFAALAAVPADVNLLAQAVPPDYNDPITRQFYTSPIITIGSPLSNFIKTVYGYTDPQMVVLFANAATYPVWG